MQWLCARAATSAVTIHTVERLNMGRGPVNPDRRSNYACIENRGVAIKSARIGCGSSNLYQVSNGRAAINPTDCNTMSRLFYAQCRIKSTHLPPYYNILSVPCLSCLLISVAPANISRAYAMAFLRVLRKYVPQRSDLCARARL